MPAIIVVPGYRAKYNLEVQFPAEVSAMYDPVAKTVEDKHFTFAYSLSFRGSLAKASIDLKTLATRVEPPDAPAFVQKVRALNELGVGTIAVAKGDIQSSTGKASGFVEKMRARVQETIDTITGTIKSGKLKGTDLGAAYCFRGTQYGNLGKLDEALADAGEAFKLAPNSGEVTSCRAFVYFLRGEFAKSIATYNAALALGDTRPETFRFRGIAKFYAWRWKMLPRTSAKRAILATKRICTTAICGWRGPTSGLKSPWTRPPKPWARQKPTENGHVRH